MCVCDRGAAAEASAKLAKAAKPKVPWIVVARKMAVEYRDDPLKYGDGSGTVSSWVVGGGTLHPSGFPESSLSQLRAACRELAQVLVANGLDAAAPAGRMAQEGALQLLTKAVSYWTENATRQAAADTAAPALPAAERPAIACSLWGNGSEEAEPFEDPAPATDP